MKKKVAKERSLGLASESEIGLQKGVLLDLREGNRVKAKEGSNPRVSEALSKELERVGLKIDSLGRVVTLDGDPSPSKTKQKYLKSNGLLPKFDA